MRRKAEKYKLFIQYVKVKCPDAAKLAPKLSFGARTWLIIGADDVAVMIYDVMPPAGDVTPRYVSQPIRKLTRRLRPVVAICATNVSMDRLRPILSRTVRSYQKPATKTKHDAVAEMWSLRIFKMAGGRYLGLGPNGTSSVSASSRTKREIDRTSDSASVSD